MISLSPGEALECLMPSGQVSAVSRGFPENCRYLHTHTHIHIQAHTYKHTHPTTNPKQSNLKRNSRNSLTDITEAFHQSIQMSITLATSHSNYFALRHPNINKCFAIQTQSDTNFDEKKNDREKNRRTTQANVNTWSSGYQATWQARWAFSSFALHTSLHLPHSQVDVVAKVFFPLSSCFSAVFFLWMKEIYLVKTCVYSSAYLIAHSSCCDMIAHLRAHDQLATHRARSIAGAFQPKSQQQQQFKSIAVSKFSQNLQLFNY